MVEEVSGFKLGDYLMMNVFDPLGMVDTAFRITPEMRERLAKIHARSEDGVSFEVLDDLEIPQDPEFQMGGGGLYGTVPDYLKFIRMILNGGKAHGHQLLKPETLAEMCQNQMGDNLVGPLTTAMPPYSNDAEFFPGMAKKWGLSFMINTEDAPTGRPAGSLAWAGLANSYFWIDLKNGIGGAYLTQILPFVDVKSLPLFLDFETAVYESMG
jgi:CubicO group peptidase (beta-lactamase class C family)